MAATKLLSDNGVTSGITGYQLTGGNDGTLQLQTTTSGGTATTAMTIDTSQNVGIGTTSPLYKFDMVGQARVVSSSNAYALTLQYNAATSGFILGSPSANALAFSNAAGTEFMRIDSSGNVGIGYASTTPLGISYSNTTAPTSGGGGISTFLNSSTSSSAITSLLFSGTDAGGTARHGAAISWGKSGAWTAGGANYGSYLSFYTRPDGGDEVERMRIDSSGNVGIGAPASAQYKLDVSGNIANAWSVFESIVELNTRQSGNRYSLIDFHSDDTYTDFGLRIGRYNTGANTDSVIANRGTGAINIVCVDAGYLKFSTTDIERARVDPSGNFMVGKTTVSDTADPGFLFYGASSAKGVVTATLNSASQNTYHLYNTNATNNGYRFYVNTNGGIYNVSGNNVNISDERTKTNIELAGGYLDKICAIPVKLFNYKDEPENEQRTLGVIAQDVEAVAPEFVNQNGWLGDAPEGEAPLKSIYTTDMMFALMKCIQEQQALINNLTERLAALEAK